MRLRGDGFNIDNHAVTELHTVHNNSTRKTPVRHPPPPGENTGASRELQRIRPQHHECALELRRRSFWANDIHVPEHPTDRYSCLVSLILGGHDTAPANERRNFA